MSTNKLYKIYDDIVLKDKFADSEVKRLNGNVNDDTPFGKISAFGTESSKSYALDKLVPSHLAKLHIDGDIHIHDLDFYSTKTTTCLQIDLTDLFKDGFYTEAGFIREPKTISTAAMLAALVAETNQLMHHGGQSYPAFDFHLAPYVEKSHLKNIEKVKEIWEESGSELDEDKIEQKAWTMTEKETLQAMQGFVYNINTLKSRGGAQCTFMSVNFGTDTSRYGRLVSKCLMQAQLEGLGKGEIALFPILVFKVKAGVNFNPTDPNYDLFKQSIEVSSKRLFPNWEFLDAPHNLQYYKDGDWRSEVATMGCRTRVVSSVFPESNGTSVKRGNASFTSINLPRLAIKANGDIHRFYDLLDEKLKQVHDQLLERLKWQMTAEDIEFPFLAHNHMLFKKDLREAIKHDSLSIGFVGLAEALTCLFGKHHGEDAKIQEEGLKIIQFMRQYTDKMSKEETLNWSVLATPAESVAGRFARMDKAEFGEIPGVTDKDYYTNSFHIPVGYDIAIYQKIDLEAPYHALTNAGHITYIEIDSDPSKNPEAIESIVRHAQQSGVGYFSINWPLDICNKCEHQGTIYNECPVCGSKDYRSIRRITGYLVGTVDRWNNGKKAELKDRIAHNQK